ncbi:HAD family hydrolase [Tistrella mobilis]|uniref:HAD family hydrolase n=1 Tax=Tistrella mobilis TaxID=171437 RepID=UPI003555D9E7
MTLTMPERGLDDAAAFARLGRPDAVLFDWDHTLVDAWGAILAAYNDVMIAYGKPPALTPEEGRLRIRRSMRDTFPEIFGDRWQEAALRFKAAYAARHLETVVAMEGAADLLDLLVGQGIPLGVVSNKQGPFLRAEVAHLGWGERFGALLGAGDAARDKPDAAPVIEALATVGREAGPNVWFVGDALVDMDCARAAGCTGILLVHDGTSLDEGVLTRADLRVVDCRHLHDLVTSAMGLT